MHSNDPFLRQKRTSIHSIGNQPSVNTARMVYYHVWPPIHRVPYDEANGMAGFHSNKVWRVLPLKHSSMSPCLWEKLPSMHIETIDWLPLWSDTAFSRHTITHVSIHPNSHSRMEMNMPLLLLLLLMTKIPTWFGDIWIRRWDVLCLFVAITLYSCTSFASVLRYRLPYIFGVGVCSCSVFRVVRSSIYFLSNSATWILISFSFPTHDVIILICTFATELQTERYTTTTTTHTAIDHWKIPHIQCNSL